jgi:cardiolipin synthase
MSPEPQDHTPNAGLWTVANVISLLRLVAIPVFLWLLLARKEVVAASLLFGVIGVTDWLDGALARALGQVSSIGKVLDPLADRLAIAAAVIGGWVVGVLPSWFAGLLILREIVMASAVAVLWFRTRKVLEVRYMGKSATFIVYGAIPAFYLAAADVVPRLFRPLGFAAGLVGLVLYWWVAARYMIDIRDRVRETEEAAPS